ncbi:Hypothetical predicted protein [Paramuricea clavata]|uniref:Uncharacterized protein n=1 Tax=Paramuricea clavata TaxID=317549 RepID=A0A6S7HHG2_PARCT|nr:Hypothetical predicted protein [Paramuricea clavata]
MAVEKASILVAVEIVGFILNKVRDWASNKLKDGDLTNEELRQVLLRDLKEINTKLDSLSLKDLDASRSFLKEGLSILIIALGQPSEDQETHEGPDEATAISTYSASSSLNQVLTLPQAIQKLQITSEKRLEEAKKSFQKARERAIDAFNNKSLSIKDRIMACKIRVAARIFESGLEDPEIAVTTCLLALEELHGLPAIQDMFKVFLNGGLRSWRNKAERLENIMSVLFINHALFHFAAKCSSKYPNVFTWPGIELEDRAFHPILHVYEIVKKTTIGGKFGQQISRMVTDKTTNVVAYANAHARADVRAHNRAHDRAYARACAAPHADYKKRFHTRAIKYSNVIYDAVADAYVDAYSRGWYFAVNSRGEVILLYDKKMAVIYCSGESKDVMFSDLSGTKVVARERRAVTVDSDDNVYVLRYLKTRDENGIKGTFVLCVLDGNYNIKHDNTLLDFLNDGEYKGMRISVDKNKNTIFIKQGDTQVFVCDNRGKFKFKLEENKCSITNIGITNKDEIMVRSTHDGRIHSVYTEFWYTPLKGTVSVYTTEGKLKSEIEVPEGHECLQVAFHHGLCKIVLLTFWRKYRRKSLFLLCYSETGELEHSVCDISWLSEIASHPSGKFAIFQGKSITLI